MSQPSLLPTGHASVMASRAKTDDQTDYFPTPPWAARAGAELISVIDPGEWSCWEPAAGGGHMAYGLSPYFEDIFQTDITDYGPHLDLVADFLSPNWDGTEPLTDWIITNPPFILGEEFVRVAMERASRGVAMLLRLVFLEGGKRFHLLHEDCPLYAVAPFSERVPMVKGRWDPDASSATAYAWFIWLKDRPAGAPRVLPIPPGTKARLTRPDDARLYGVKAETPLLDGSAA